jgi:hypothetical protein
MQPNVLKIGRHYSFSLWSAIYNLLIRQSATSSFDRDTIAAGAECREATFQPLFPEPVMLRHAMPALRHAAVVPVFVAS